MTRYVYYPTDELGFDQRAEYHGIGAWIDRVAETLGWKAPHQLLA